MRGAVRNGHGKYSMYRIYFALFKGSIRRETRGFGKMAIVEWRSQTMTIGRNSVHCTVHYTLWLYIVQYYFFRNITSMLVLIEESLLYLLPCCLANSPFRVPPGQGSNPGPFGRQACYQPTNDDLCFGFFLMFLCLICTEAGACSSHISPPILDIFGSQFFLSAFSPVFKFSLGSAGGIRNPCCSFLYGNFTNGSQKVNLLCTGNSQHCKAVSSQLVINLTFASSWV